MANRFPFHSTALCAPSRSVYPRSRRRYFDVVPWSFSVDDSGWTTARVRTPTVPGFVILLPSESVVVASAKTVT